MKRTLSAICSDIASYASDKNHEFLASLLRMAAIEAASNAPLDSLELNEVGPGNLVVGVFDWDVPNNVRHLDPTGSSLFGYSSETTITDQHLMDRIHPDDVAEWRRRVYMAVRIGGLYEYEYRIIKNDSVVWVRAKGQCILSPTGRPLRFPGAVIDVTRLKEKH